MKELLWLPLLLLLLLQPCSTHDGISLLTPTVGKGAKCEPITIPMCRGMRYNLTTMPNMFKQHSQEDAYTEISQFQPLLNVNCSSELQLFLCSMYTPICIPEYASSIPVCRSVCERVKAGCYPLMKYYKFIWPEKMECHLLPEVSTDDQLCMDPIGQENEERMREEVDSRARRLGSKLVVSGGLREDPGNMNSEDEFYVFVEDGSEADYDEYDDEYEDGDRSHQRRFRCPCRKCENAYGENPLVSIDSEDFLANKSVYFGGIPGCVMSCRSPFSYPFSGSSSLLEHVLILLTVLCLLSTIFTVVAFLVTIEKYNYPETPIMYFAICYVMVGLGFSLRLIFGHETVACEQRYSPLLVRQYFSPQHNLMAEIDSQGPILCTLVFVCTYTFLMAAAMWWLMLAYTWFLSAVFHWAPESIEKYTKWIHGVCWGVPFLETFLVVVTNAVDGDNISGLCLVGAVNHVNLVGLFLAPLMVKIGVGVILLASGMLGVSKVWKMIDEDQKNKLQWLMLKISAFSLVFVVPMLVVTAAWCYEILGRAKWEQAVVCRDCIRGEKAKPNFSVYIIKYSMMLVPGVLTFCWVLNGKLLEASVARAHQLVDIFRAPRKEQIYETPRSPPVRDVVQAPAANYEQHYEHRHPSPPPQPTQPLPLPPPQKKEPTPPQQEKEKEAAAVATAPPSDTAVVINETQETLVSAEPAADSADEEVAKLTTKASSVKSTSKAPHQHKPRKSARSGSGSTTTAATATAESASRSRHDHSGGGEHKRERSRHHSSHRQHRHPRRERHSRESHPMQTDDGGSSSAAMKSTDRLLTA